MLRQLTIEINCGATTCASELGAYCEFLGATRFGTIWSCRPGAAYTGRVYQWGK
jgi:hypothetical protein